MIVMLEMVELDTGLKVQVDLEEIMKKKVIVALNLIILYLKEIPNHPHTFWINRVFSPNLYLKRNYNLNKINIILQNQIIKFNDHLYLQVKNKLNKKIKPCSLMDLLRILVQSV